MVRLHDGVPYQLRLMDKMRAFEAHDTGPIPVVGAKWVLDKLVKSLVFETRVVLGSKPRDPAMPPSFG